MVPLPPPPYEDYRLWDTFGGRSDLLVCELIGILVLSNFLKELGFALTFDYCCFDDDEVFDCCC